MYILYILLAVLMFSALIFVHELGHFATAKLFGIQVNEFSMFMGPAIWKKQVGETLYSIRCIPLGGYCAMEGEDGESDNPRAFGKAAWWKKLIVLAAGAAMNFLFGVLVFAVLYLPMEQVAAPVITQFADCCNFNHEDGLRLGDEILEIDGEKVYLNGDISVLLGLDEDGVHDVLVLREGKELLCRRRPLGRGHRDGDGAQYRHYGFGFGKARDLDLGGKLGLVWNVTLDNLRNVRLSLEMLFSGKAGIADLSGPVGIVDMMSESASAAETLADAMGTLLSFSGMLAVNLAVMNLLPIPALDGGRIVCLALTEAVERVTKKKLDPKYEGYLHAAGMILLLGLMAIVMFKDIFTIFKG